MVYDHARKLRAELLSNNPGACVARELWSCGCGTYSAYRECVLARKQLSAQHLAYASPYGGAARPADGSRGGDGVGRRGPAGSGAPHSLPATVKYSFEGVKHVLAESSAAVTVVAFAALRSDLLAFGCVDGELRLASLPASPTAQSPPACTKTRKMHSQAIQALDWAYDNSQLLSVGRDGSLCVWDAVAPEVPCIRSISVHTTAFLCGRFHRVNFSLAMVGTSGGSLEVYNCSTGMLHSHYKVSGGSAAVQVTALDCSNHTVFLGDSTGQLHMYASELQGRHLSRLRPAGRLRLAAPAAGQPPAAVTALQYEAFCHATDSPVLLAALQDGAVCIVKANETRHTAELHLRRHVPPPSLSAVTPYVTSSPASRTPSTRPSPHSSAPSTPGHSRRGEAPPMPVLPSPASSAAEAAATAANTAAAAAAISTLMRVSPAVCPLSVIHDVPLITYGSDDTSVYIVDMTARSFGGTAGRGGGGGGGGAGGGGGGGSGLTVDRPLTVTVLKAHRAPVIAVSWSYDESLLASADGDGMVVVWQRSRLF